MRRTPYQGAIVAVLLAFLAGCEAAGTEETPAAAMADSVEAVDSAMLTGLPAGTSLEILEEGRRQFVVCTVCHGLEGNGTQLGPSLRDTTWIHITRDIPAIAQVIRTGVPTPAEFPVPMPVMGGGDFDEGELRALATYVYALGRQGG